MEFQGNNVFRERTMKRTKKFMEGESHEFAESQSICIYLVILGQSCGTGLSNLFLNFIAGFYFSFVALIMLRTSTYGIGTFILTRRSVIHSFNCTRAKFFLICSIIYSIVQVIIYPLILTILCRHFFFRSADNNCEIMLRNHKGF